MSRTFYVTTPIYYVNDVPHIGHAYTTVAADVAARYHRLKGDEVYFLTGTDEHGLKVERAAAENGVDPQTWTDQISGRFRELIPKLDITNDDFIRTSQARHTERVQRFVQDLYDRGQIYAGEYEGLYCVSCEAFYLESELVEGNCPVHDRPVEKVREQNYFFRLSEHADWLLNEYYARKPAPVQPQARLNEVVSFVRGGLEDISISRPSVEWGIPVPWDPKHVIYVWIDALQNYITALGYPDGELFKTFWPAVHLVGKEIIRFHAVIWPAMLHAAGIDPPDLVFAHGWLLVGGEKMSKTKLTGIHPDELLPTFGSDGYRYLFLRDVQFGQDGNFSWEGFVARYNAELANGLGNLAARVLALIGSNFDGVVPQHGTELDPERALRSTVEKSVVAYEDALDRFAFHEGLDAVDRIVRQANGYLVETAPWKLAKEPGNEGRVETILWAAAETLRVLAVLLSPFTPRASASLWDQLGIGEPLAQQLLPAAARWGGLAPGAKVTKGESLFPRIDT